MSGGTRLIMVLVPVTMIGAFVVTAILENVWIAAACFVGLPLFSIAFVALVAWLDRRYPGGK